MVDDGKLILVRRSAEPGAGCWDIPGGFCEAHEQPSETARREVLEEVGLEVRVTGFLGMWIDTYGDADPPEITLNIYFLAETDHPELARTSAEVEEVGWFRPGDVPSHGLAFDHIDHAIREWVRHQTSSPPASTPR